MSDDPPSLLDRATFKHWAPETIRFGDTDRLGHVNNAVFATLSETGRVMFLLDPDMPSMGAGQHWVIARLTVDFRAELHWPDKVEIGTTVLRVGRSSVTLGQGIFKGDACVATCENILVMIDLESRRSVPIPDDLREALVAWSGGV